MKPVAAPIRRTAPKSSGKQRLLAPGVELPRKLVDSNAVILKSHQQVVYQIGGLVANVVVIDTCIKRNFHGLLTTFFKTLSSPLCRRSAV